MKTTLIDHQFCPCDCPAIKRNPSMNGAAAVAKIDVQVLPTTIRTLQRYRHVCGAEFIVRHATRRARPWPRGFIEIEPVRAQRTNEIAAYRALKRHTKGTR